MYSREQIVLGIYIIILGINALFSVLTVSFGIPNHVTNESFINNIFSLVYILFGVLLWILSDKLSAIMVAGGKHTDKVSDLFLPNSYSKIISISIYMN